MSYLLFFKMKIQQKQTSIMIQTV